MELVAIVLSGWSQRRVKKLAGLHGVGRDDDSESLCADVVIFVQEFAGRDA